MPENLIKIYMDGDEWCALVGDDLQSGTAGFGITPNVALADLQNRLADEVSESGRKQLTLRVEALMLELQKSRETNQRLEKLLRVASNNLLELRYSNDILKSSLEESQKNAQ